MMTLTTRWALPSLVPGLAMVSVGTVGAASLPSAIDLGVTTGEDRLSIEVDVRNLVESGFDEFAQRAFVPDIGGDGIVELALFVRDATGTRCSLVLVPSELSRSRRIDADALGAFVTYDDLDAFATEDDGGDCFFDRNDLVSLGDVNGDGVRDLGVRSAGALVLHGRIDAGARVDVAALSPSDGFHVSDTFFVGNNRDAGSVGDLDGDGLDDIGLGDRASGDDRLRVLRGVPARAVVNAFRTLPDEDLLVDLGLTFQFPEVVDLGDTNGDGADDLLVATFASGPYVVEGAPGPRLRAPSLDAIEGLRLVDECGEPGRSCRFGAAGDVDGDGLGDLIGTVAGFPDERQPAGYEGPDGVIVYGRAGGLPRVGAAAELRGRGITELVDVALGPAGTIGGFTEFVGGGDLDGDGLSDVISGGGLIVLGDATRPATVALDRLDGVNGLIYRGNTGRVFAGDIDGDGVDDLISDDRDGEPVAVLGRRDDGAPRPPVDVLVRYGPVTTDVLWFAPREAEDIVGYRAFVDGVRVADADADARSLTFRGPTADPDSSVGLVSVGLDGRLSPVVRYRFDTFGTRIGGLVGEVYAPTSGELSWPRAQVGDASVWREGDYLTTVRGSSLFLDDLVPGSSTSFFITSQFVRPTDTGRSTLRSGGPVYARSEPLTLTTPGGAPTPGPDTPAEPGGAPTTPGSLRASIYSTTAIELFWERSADDGFVRGYEIARDGRPVATLDATSFFDADLPGAGRYAYSVTALDFDGNRSLPASVVVGTGSVGAPGDPERPPAPTGLRADTYSSTAFEVFWDRVPNAGVVHDVLIGDRAPVRVDGTSLFVGDAPGRVEVQVIRVAASGERSDASGIVVRAGMSADGPTPPTGLRAVRYSSTAGELFWARDAAPGQRYEIRVAGGRTLGTTDGTSYFVADLDAGGRAELEVVALGTDGVRSAPATVTVAAP